MGKRLDCLLLPFLVRKIFFENLSVTEYNTIMGNKDEYLSRQDWYQVAQRARYALLRYGVFEHYGMECACCGESHFEFLCIDHIDGGGNEHRRKMGGKGGSRMYSWLKKNGYPEGFRTLCHNCNFCIGAHGRCVHEYD